MHRSNVTSSDSPLYDYAPQQLTFVGHNYKTKSEEPNSTPNMASSVHHTMTPVTYTGGGAGDEYISAAHGKDRENMTVISNSPSSIDTQPDPADAMDDSLPADAAMGLTSPRAMFFLFLWYFFSLLTLFLNRIILTSLGGDPVVLSTFQMVGTTLLGGLQMRFPCGMFKKVKREGPWPVNFYRNMIIVGTCRFGTVFLGLLALEYVEVSFTETVKSSAPLFTVLIARLLTGELTGFYTQLSLIPIMGGLALCSAFELSFNVPGFVAALGTNISEWPAEMQYYSSVASIIIQVPCCIFLTNFTRVRETWSNQLLVSYLANGCFFHYQTICAYVLMGYISPVTHSVANTVKRALLIWLSILFFGNTVTFLSGFGTTIVFLGVLCYNRAKNFDQAFMVTTVMYREAKVSSV